jgi:hypothetical protein
MSFSHGGATDAACTVCAQGNISAAGSSACQMQEHPVIELTIPGSIHTFSEGSDRRRSFVAGLAALLQVPERQIVVASVRAGSIIVELAFARDAASSVFPSDIVARLKDAAAAGNLQTLGATSLSIGGQSFLVNVSTDSGQTPLWGIILAIVLWILAFLCHARFFAIVKDLHIADSPGWIIAAVLFGPLIWIIWALYKCFRRKQIQKNSTVLNKVRTCRRWLLVCLL